MSDAMNEDAYFKKVVTFRAWRRSLQFRVSQELFSSQDIDLGTKLLLRTIVEAGYDSPGEILDLGCGYGPIGLTLKSLHPEAVVHMVDRDALAVEYSRQNAALNKLTGIEVYGGLGYDDLKTTGFDLIVSNIPAKAGEPVVSYLLKESAHYLSHNGLVAVVVVKPLEQLVEKVFADTPEISVLARRSRPGHSVFHYRFTENPPPPVRSAVERGIFDRAAVEFRTGGLEYPMRVAYGLPEFDSLSYDSELLMRTLQGLPRSGARLAVVFNPGQGHLAVAVRKLFEPERIILVDRDLLALRFSQTNLILNGFPGEKVVLSHRPGMESTGNNEADLFVIRLREEGREANAMVVKQAAGKLRKNGIILVGASSTAATRLTGDLEGILNVRSRERWRGCSVMVLVK